jgi:hydroxyacylglutathione hydrolase
VLDTIGPRTVAAIVCTQAHDDHINGAVPPAEKIELPVLLHPADHELRTRQNPYDKPHWQPSDDEVPSVARLGPFVLHTPGQTWGSMCPHIPELGALFSGDTLFVGGPASPDHLRFHTGHSTSPRSAPMRYG